MMKLGFFLYGPGHHIAAWRDPGTAAELRRQSPPLHRDHASGGARPFDMVFNADSNSTFGPDDINIWKRNAVSIRLEPLSLLGALAATTERIGLVATATTTYLDPYYVARTFATLDRISGGRIGWNVVTSSASSEALNFGHAAHVPHADRYERAAEYIEVAQGLWDTFDDDAFRFDKDAGLFFEPSKLHMLNHKGKHFQVRGPLMMPRSPQGQPVIVQAGQSEAGLELAARRPRAVHGAAADRAGAEVLRRPQGAHRRHGRSPDSIKVMPGVLTVVGRSRDEARRSSSGFRR